jgi:hypothetical protein
MNIKFVCAENIFGNSLYSEMKYTFPFMFTVVKELLELYSMLKAT